MTAREAVLARVRAALGDGPPGALDPPEQPPPAGPDRSAAGLTERFAGRAGDYGTSLERTHERALARTIARVAGRHRATRFVVPEGLPEAWLPPSLDVRSDRVGARLRPDELDAIDGVITGCLVAIAETGSLVLSDERRALTLLPDLHICVVRTGQIVDDVPQAIAAVAPVVRDRHRPVTFVSGPSATSDIEFARVEGVHGPRRLEVILVG